MVVGGSDRLAVVAVPVGGLVRVAVWECTCEGGGVAADPRAKRLAGVGETSMGATSSTMGSASSPVSSPSVEEESDSPPLATGALLLRGAWATTLS